MTKDRVDRLETRIRKDLKKSLRIYCAQRDLTIRKGVEQAIELLVGKRLDGQPNPDLSEVPVS